MQTVSTTRSTRLQSCVLHAPDIPRGVGRIRFYSRNGEMLDVMDIRGGFGIVADDSSLDVPRVTFVTMLIPMGRTSGSHLSVHRTEGIGVVL